MHTSFDIIEGAKTAFCRFGPRLLFHVIFYDVNPGLREYHWQV